MSKTKPKKEHLYEKLISLNFEYENIESLSQIIELISEKLDFLIKIENNDKIDFSGLDGENQIFLTTLDKKTSQKYWFEDSILND